MNIISSMNINHKTRMLYGSVLLVLLVILYYYYTRIQEGAKNKNKNKNAAATTATQQNPTGMQQNPMGPMGQMPMVTIQQPTNAQIISLIKTELKKEKEKEIKVEQIKDSYVKFYQLMSDKDKNKIKKVYHHFVENVIKDEYP